MRTKAMMSRLDHILESILEMPRSSKQLVLLLLDLSVLPFLVASAYAIRQGRSLTMPEDWWMLPLGAVSTVLALYAIRFYRVVARHFTASQAGLILLSVALAAMVMAAAAFMVPAVYTHRSVFLIYAILASFYLLTSRLLIGSMARQISFDASTKRQPVAIYGAGGAGVEAAMALMNSRAYRPVVFVDDDKSKQKSTIRGLHVVGRSRLRKLVARGSVEMVLLGMPSISRGARGEIIRFLEELEVPVKSVPRLPDIISGKARIEEVRDVSVEDLLGRDAVPPDARLLRSSVTGKNVLVTGAGGSIGSELCRQLVGLRPSSLTLLDISEFSLYSIEHELRPRCEEQGIDLDYILASVTDEVAVAQVFAKRRIQTVYHAAAYKHVPIVEHNECVGALNNVFGTWTVAEAARRAETERFILVSTDKAVRPTNVMGATKRMAEMVLQALAKEEGNTCFSMVRFGNVLGSSGSVVPLFRRQIKNGGPVTVTHPEVTRYFMTIPEAAQLVIQAGAMASGGEVFLLDMGEPVRILELARTMVHLMGMTVRDSEQPDGDIEIRFTGLRPGEKLFEELLIGEDSIGTDHPAILQATEESSDPGMMTEVLRQLDLCVRAGDAKGVRRLLSEHVHGYVPPPLEGQKAFRPEKGDSPLH